MSSPGTADLDGAALTAWLEQHVTGFRGPIALTKFEGGQSNPTYRLDAANRTYVLRRKPFGTLLPSAHAVEREYRVLTALHALGFAVPRAFALCQDQGVIGSAFYLMALVEGANFTDGALPCLTKDARALVYHGMIDTLAALHRIDPQAAGLSTFGRPRPPLGSHPKPWTLVQSQGAEDWPGFIRRCLGYTVTSRD